MCISKEFAANLPGTSSVPHIRKEYILMFFLAVLCFLFFYRGLILSGFDFLHGDAGDARLNILIADSWRDYMSGRLPFGQTRIFYPYEKAQGFTDLSLSLYLLEIPFRLLGMDEYRSAQLVYVFLFFLAVMTMFHLCRCILHFSFPISAFCALFAFLNHAFWVKQFHTQFYFLYLLPPLFICLFRYFQYWNDDDKKVTRWCCIAGACLVFSCISYSNFYNAFFFVVWFLLYFAGYLLIRILDGERVWRNFTVHLPEVAAGVLFLLLLHLPFLWIYSLVLKSGYFRDWWVVMYGLPVLSDILNIGKDNLLWGQCYQHYFSGLHKNVYEFSYGLPPLTFLLVLFSAVLFFIWEQRKKILPIWFVALAASLFVLYFLSLFSLKLYPQTSLWYFVWKFLPGGNALRACGRIYVFMMVPLTIFLGGMLDYSLGNLRGSLRNILFGVIFFCIFLDNLSTLPFSKWKYSDVCHQLEQIPVPPPDCRIFFLAPEQNSEKPVDASYFGLDAWQIASRFQLFTLNGYSGNFPHDWMNIFDITRPEYRIGISDWISRNKLVNVYQYDRVKKLWLRYDMEELHFSSSDAVTAGK